MKRVLKSALIFLPFVLLIVCVNVYADPANVLNFGYEQQIAEILASGKNVENLRNMDDRSFMKEYVKLRTEPVGTLGLGSSHSMQLTKELTGDDAFFGAGVTGADMRDCISIYRLFRDKGLIPQRVILSVDYWFMSEGTFETRAMTDGYKQFCRDHGLRPLASDWLTSILQKLEKKGEAISIPYFQKSLQYMKKGLHRFRDPIPTDVHKSSGNMRRADGSFCYEEWYREAPQEDINLRAEGNIVSKPEFARGFNGVSKELEKQLEAFLDEMISDGVEVAVFFSPYHPAYYDHMASSNDNYIEILDTERIVTEIAQRHGVKVFGSFNPHVLGLTEADFYDGLHCTEEAMYQFYPQDLFEIA